MDRKFIDCITSFDSGFFVFLSCALSLSLVFIAFPFDFTMGLLSDRRYTVAIVS